MTSLRFGAIGTGREFERPAVDQKRGAGDAAGGDILIHDAAAHADELVLGPLTDRRRFDRLERQPGRGERGRAQRSPRAPPTN